MKNRKITRNKLKRQFRKKINKNKKYTKHVFICLVYFLFLLIFLLLFELVDPYMWVQFALLNTMLNIFGNYFKYMSRKPRTQRLFIFMSTLGIQ